MLSRVLGYTINFTYDYARARLVELDVAETMKEELVSIARGYQGGTMTVEIGYGSGRYGWSTDDGMKGQSK